MINKNHFRPIAPLLFLLLFIFALLTLRQTSAQSANILTAAWERTERIGSYDFTTALTQTTYPAPRITSFGYQARYDTLYLEGNADRRAGTLDLAIWDDPATVQDRDHAIEMRVDGTRTQGRTSGGEWQQMEDISTAFAPTGDAAAFLVAARNIRELGSESRDFPLAAGGERTVSFERYAFTFDGVQYAEHMRSMLQAQMRDSGELPAGVSLSGNDYFRDAVGAGEVWIDSNGLPLRMAMEIEFPQAQNGERSTLDVETNFVAYHNASRVNAVAFSADPLQFITTQLSALPTLTKTVQALTVVGATVTLLGLGWLAVIYRPKQSYRAFATFLSAQLMFAPLTVLVDVQKMDVLRQRFPSMAPSLEPEQPDVAAILASSAETQLFNITQSPLETGAIRYQQQQDIDAILTDQEATAAGRVPTASGIDLDQDGLDSDIEAIWGLSDTEPDYDGDGVPDGAEVALCPVKESSPVNIRFDPANVNDPACSDPFVKDTDGDGLTDGEEILHLGTYARSSDSDNDGISDYNEVHGFYWPNSDCAPGDGLADLPLGANDRCYTNPLNPDTDGDRLLDGIECPSMMDTVWTATTTCVDTNNKGVADVFSLDNDGDGVVNRADSSPNTLIRPSGYFNEANPLQLNLLNVTQNTPTLVDIQIRPQQLNHLAYAHNILDWPTGDTKGQIRRLVDSTWGDLDTNAAIGSLAYAGDMRLTPMLEFRMAGNTQDLPRTVISHTVDINSAGQTVALATISKVSDTSSKLTMTTLPNSATISIQAGSCKDGNTVFTHFPTLSEGSVVDFNSTPLGKYTDGAHSLSVKVGNDTFCEPIAALVEGSAKVNVHLQRQGTPLASVNLHGTAGLTFSFANTVAQYDVRTFDSCDDQSTPRDTWLGVAHGSVKGTSNIAELVDGDHVMTLSQGTKVLSCTPLGNVINGSLGTMIDSAELAPFQISVQEDTDGDLLAMVPLILQEDPDTGEPIAFNAQMYYQRSTSAALSHEVRLVWVLSMLTDRCPDDDCAKGDTNVTQIVHSFRNEPWYVTGISVQEQWGMQVAVVNEDPTTDIPAGTAAEQVANRNLQFDDNLWWLARSLQRTFITGRDNDNNDVRDIAIGDIKARWDSATSYTDAQRFSIRADALNVHTFTVPHQAALGELSSVEIPAILTSEFGDGNFNQTDVNGHDTTTVAPTLLIAREETVRGLGLDDSADINTSSYVNVNQHALTINLDSTGVEKTLIASMSWKPFRYDDTQAAWEAYPLADYLVKFEDVLPAAADFDPTLPIEETYGSDPEADAAYERVANLLMAKNIYAYFYLGVSNAVLFGTDLTFKANDDDNPTDEDLEAPTEFALERGKEVGGLMAAYVGEMYVPISAEYDRYKRIKGKPIRRLAAVRDLTLKGAIGRANSHAWSALKVDLKENFGNVSGSGLRGRLNQSATIGVSAGSLAMGIIGGLVDASSDDIEERATALTISSIEAASAILESAQGVKAYRAWKLFRPDKAFTIAKFSQTLQATKAAKVAAVIGLIIEAGIAFGVYLFQVLAASVKFGSLAFNEATAKLIGTLVVAVLLAALATTGIGAIVVAIIVLIDALIALVCGIKPPEEEPDTTGEKAYAYFCKGISGLMAELVAFLIYDQTDIIDVNDSDRISFLRFNPHLVTPKTGFVPGAALDVDMDIRNTVTTEGPNGIGVAYAWQFSSSNTRRAAFLYDIVPEDIDDEDDQLHNNTSMGAHTEEWVYVGDDKFTIDRSMTGTGIVLPDPGINRKVDAYFVEGYQSPTQECIMVPIPLTVYFVPVCWVRANDKSSYNDLNILFDVFPTTLDAFYTLTDKDGGYALAWGQVGDLKMPRLLDADGDGLTYLVDPDDSTIDKDGDGLSDARELQLGTNVLLADGDLDGVSDADELRQGTDPLLRDVDADGMNDGEERAGWLITYNSAGDQTRVWSNPLVADADGDFLNDRREKALGFSPRVASDPTILSYDVDISEPYAPIVLLPLDEMAQATTFGDSARPDSFLTASCAEPTCPIAGHQGRVGNAVAFDGVDDYLTLGTIEGVNELTYEVTASAWIRPNHTTGTQTILATSQHIKDDGFMLTLEDDKVSFTLVRPDIVVVSPPGLTVVPDYKVTMTNFNVPISEWTHVAVMTSLVNFNDDIQYVFFINGELKQVWTIDHDGSSQSQLLTASTGELMIGAMYQNNRYTSEAARPEIEPTVTINHFDGRIDDVAIFGKKYTLNSTTSNAAANDAGERLATHRYDPDDGIVAPNGVIDFATNLRNQLFGRNIEGLIETTMPDEVTCRFNGVCDWQQTDFTLKPNSGVDASTSALRYVEDVIVDTNTPSGVYTITQKMRGIVDVPPLPIPGQFDNQVAREPRQLTFDGEGTGWLYKNDSFNLNNTDFTIAMWLLPTSVSGRRGVLGYDSGPIQTGTYNPDEPQGDAYPSLQIVDGKISFGFGSNGVWGTRTSTGTYLTANSSEWKHIAVSYNKTSKLATLFVNAVPVETLNFTQYSGPTNSVGKFTLGRSTDIGKIDFGNVTIQCEEDPGEPYFDIVGYTPYNATTQFNIWGKELSEDASFNINKSVVFRKYMDFAMCENDSDESDHSTCDSDDDFMGRKRFYSFDDPIDANGYRFSTTPSNSTCSFWKGYDDWATLDYDFSRESAPYEGMIRDMRIIKSTVNQAQIENIWQSNEIIARYKFNDRPGNNNFEDEVAATTARCSFGNSIGGNHECPLSIVEGRENGALLFDGFNDEVKVTGATRLINAHLTTTASPLFTMAAWIKPQSTGTNEETVLAISNNSVGHVVRLSIVPSGSGTYSIKYVSGPVTLTYGSYPMDQWRHVMILVAPWTNLTQVLLYVDGVYRTFVSNPSTMQIPTSADTFYVGSSGFGGGQSSTLPPYEFTGVIDDVYIGKGHGNDIALPVMRDSPQYRYSFDEDGLGATVNLNGQIQDSQQFNGFEDAVSVPSFPNFWNGDFTLTAWVLNEDIGDGAGTVYRPILGSPYAGTGGIFFGLRNNKPYVHFGKSGSGTTPLEITTAIDLPPNQWTQLTFMREGSTFKILQNGSEIGTATHKITSGLTGTQTTIGSGYVNPASSNNFWLGRLDEVAIYAKALPAIDLIKLYNFQVTWIDDARSANFTVDADDPTGSLQTLPAFMPLAASTMTIYGDGTGSTAVSAIFYSRELENDSEISSFATPCLDADGNTALCAMFDPPNEGKYDTYFRVIDQVGNISDYLEGDSVVVDGSPPIITLEPLPSTPLRPLQLPNESALWSISLSGTVTDSLVPYGFDTIMGPGSGIETLTVSLFDANAEPVGEPLSQTATRTDDSWSLGYQLRADNPTGRYHGTITAIDKMGNTATLPIPEFAIDTTPPETVVTDFDAPMVTVGSGRSAVEVPQYLGKDAQIGGTVDETPADLLGQDMIAGASGVQISAEPRFQQGSPTVNTPLPTSVTFYMPFDKAGASETISDTTFSDLVQAHLLTCDDEHCPESGFPSRSGQALQFDGDDYLYGAYKANINGLTSNFSVAAWIRPQTLPISNAAFVVGSDSSNEGFALGTLGNQIVLNLLGVQQHVSTQANLQLGKWTHIAAHLKANNDVDFYQNGILIETVSGSNPANANVTQCNLSIGGAAGTSLFERFTGVIDEVMVKQGGLTAAELTTFMGLAPSLHLTFDEQGLGDGSRPNDAAGMGGSAVFDDGSPEGSPLHSVAGIVGSGALQLDFSDNLQIFGEAGVLPHAAPLTLSFWVRDGEYYAFWMGDVGFEKYAGDNAFNFYNQSGGYCYIPLGAPDGVHHVAISSDGVTPLKVYWDGELATATCPIITTASLGNVQELSLSNGTQAMQLDDFRFYQRVLSAEEVAWLAQSSWQDVSIEQRHFVTGAAPIVIPDDESLVEVCQPIVVSGVGSADISDLTVQVAVEHTYSGDMRLRLLTPANQAYTLLAPEISSAGLMADYPLTFFDGASNAADEIGTDIFYGETICRNDGLCHYQPIADPFSGPVSADGTWQLCANDAVGGDQGTLHSWNITFDTPADWSASLDGDLEGFYDLKARATDASGNFDTEVQPTWSGIIDTVAPRMLITETVGARAWEYRLVIEDFNLVESSLAVPAACDGNTTTLLRELYTSPWYLAFEEQSGLDKERVVRLDVTCSTASPLPPDAVFMVCDLTGNCTLLHPDGSVVPTRIGAVTVSAHVPTVSAVLIVLVLLLGLATFVVRPKRKRRS